MNAILLPIKPRYASLIYGGQKLWEFRRRPASRVGKLVLYTTKPVGLVEGEADVLETVESTTRGLWDLVKDDSPGVSPEEYKRYFDGVRIAHAYRLGKARRYNQGRELAYYGLKRPPQSFVYLEV
jgi:predicted transcriptional regulator